MVKVKRAILTLAAVCALSGISISACTKGENGRGGATGGTTEVEEDTTTGTTAPGTVERENGAGGAPGGTFGTVTTSAGGAPGGTFGTVTSAGGAPGGTFGASTTAGTTR